MEPWQFILLAVAAVSLGYSLIRGQRQRLRLQKQDSLADAQADIRGLETSAHGLLQQLEVRTYDYSREVEARINNRLTVLDQLIVDADREIERLQVLLAESRAPARPDRPLTLDEQQRCFALKEAGCTPEEIARCLEASLQSVQNSLDEWQRVDRRAA